jgi:CBS-domain-containing membrane protein
MKNPMRRLESLKVADVMAHKVVAVGAAQPMVDVASQFVRNEISSAPVVNEQGVCVGMLSAFDFLKRASALTKMHTASDSSSAENQDRAESFMSSGVQTVPAGASLLKVAMMMCSQHVHRLPVIDDAGKPIGIVSTMDIVAAFLNAIDEAQLEGR